MGQKHTEAPDWDYPTTLDIIREVPNTHLRGFIALSYVGGLRINEARWFQSKNMGIISTQRGDRVVFRIRNEKNPYRAFKDIPLNPVTEKEYLGFINEAIDHKQPNDFIFQQQCERWYRLHIRKNLDIHPHALRHLRVHHIDDRSIPGMESLTPRQYQDYFGWASISTSSKYQSRTRSMDLANLF